MKAASMRMAALGLWVPLLAACDPCAGLASCRTDPQVNYSGRIIDRDTGRPVAGARIDFVRVGGVAITPDTLTGISAADGFFSLRGAMAGDGIVYGDYIVTPPPSFGLAPYKVGFQPLGSRPRAGDGGDLGTLVIQPYFVFIGDVRNAAGQRIRGARLDYRWTGGVAATPSDTTVTSDGDAVFFILFRAQAYGVIEGEFTLRSATGAPLGTVPVRIHTSHTMHTPYGTQLRFGANGS